MTTKKADTEVAANDTAAESAATVDTSARHYAAQDFTDAGTGRAFEKGALLTELDEGTLSNYAAGGLATAVKLSTSA